MTVIVDTCVWTRFLRRNRERGEPLCAEVTRLVRDDTVQMLGCIRQEILSGAQPQDRFEQLKEYLRFYPTSRSTRRTTRTPPVTTTLAAARAFKAPPPTC